MPQITTDPGILEAARSAIEQLLKFKGQPVELNRRGMRVPKPGGGHDYTGNVTLPTQVFAWSQLGDDEQLDGENGETPVFKRTYALTGRWNADIRADDTWADGEARYRVDTVNGSNGFKTSAIVVGFVKVGP